MEKSHIIMGLLLFIIVLVVINQYKQENLDASGLSNEALQNIASVYGNKDKEVSFNNVNVTGTLNLKTFKGIIVAWSGAIADIPAGWGFCNGTKYKALDGTDLQSPDLRSKFIIGASKPGTSTNGSVDGWGPDGQPSYTNMPLAPRMVANQGGEENHKLTIAEMPSHGHSYSAMRNDIGSEYYNGSVIGYSYPNWWALKANSSPTGNVGGDQQHNNMPPFYALAYIIKL
jgi:microcystin-dependent protein